jgi:hypothetical protein
VDWPEVRVRTAFLASLDLKDTQASVSDHRFSLCDTLLCTRVGDVGEPGLHGGYSQPGHKGEIGILAQLGEMHGETRRLL